MTEVIEEKPLENMSFEEISDHMDKIENVESEEVKEVENTEEPVVEEQQESEEKVEPVQEAEQEVVQYDDEVDNPYFKGKSKKELVEIIQNGTRKISQLGNEINSTKKQIQDLIDIQKKSNKTEIEEKKEKELENDIFSRYDKDDISAIKELVKTTLIEEKENKTRISQQEKDRNAQDNEAYWSSMSLKIKSKNPDLFNKIESTLLAEMEDKGKDQTLQHAGWVQDRIGDLLLDPSGSTGVSKSQSPQNKTNIVKKKVKAATIGSGNNVSSSDSNLKGKQEPKDPDEYAKWAEQNLGIKI